MLEAAEHRAVCVDCLRPTSVCCCSLLPRLESRVRLVVVQHPREHRKPIGTAWMAVRAVRDAHLFVTATVDEAGPLARLLSDPARPAVLLWPGDGARDLEVDPPDLPATLVVVDGTWSTAKKLLERNPLLRRLPRVRLRPARLSRYRIRKEPRTECLSTVEAVSQALGYLERAPGKFEPMLAAFERMVDIQIDYEARGGGRRFTLPRGPRLPRAAPRELAGIEDCVILFAEASSYPYSAPDRPADELLHLVARRIGDGARLEVLARPSRGLAPHALQHAELSPDAMVAALQPLEARGAIEAFFRPQDRLVGWGSFSRDLVRASGASVPETFVDLKPVAARTTNGKLGSLEAVTSRLEIDAESVGAGRAGRRLGLATALVSHLVERFGGADR